MKTTELIEIVRDLLYGEITVTHLLNLIEMFEGLRDSPNYIETVGILTDMVRPHSPRFKEAAGKLQLGNIPGSPLSFLWEDVEECPHRHVMQVLEGGTFMMGDKGNQKETSVESLLIGKYPVTQSLWEEVMGDNPSHFKEDDLCPVECVSFFDACAFANALSVREGLEPVYYFVMGQEESESVALTEKTSETIWAVEVETDADGYRLPTEEEWEYACRAGTTTDTYNGDLNEGSQSEVLGEIAWYRENSDQRTHPVGEKKPNNWGLHDTLGNVWEWTQSPYRKE